MGYRICAECGQYEEFYCKVIRHAEGYSYFDNDSEPWKGRYEDDSNEEPEYEDIMCVDCDSTNVEEFDTEEELLKFRSEHTDLEEDWSEVELDKEERNKELLKQLNINKL